MNFINRSARDRVTNKRYVPEEPRNSAIQPARFMSDQARVGGEHMRARGASHEEGANKSIDVEICGFINLLN